ncbi:hypothetical protein BX616_005835 [Lobosporangium transversale]|uniref:C3H1-type domain-containing protein n=1 Tax=Lobosporangium transversale TaxID=64571 RepID=A0A1Y2GJC9_9FUNG|nr:hypothetical protein BCR41DRAFT_356287 [Lobosporangium transversale]KAF9915577.1 hypothetical protein BX616_005835 [Lobosporangium transversale]ORZ12558.1 hypothetical protein BCR41DRAFT_356287 [Lobosporangium transversale]|eukprot:XP_021880177.1 hypothetical protein BCR41DRAFT_356287 [Lobosporangium transversale]
MHTVEQVNNNNHDYDQVQFRSITNVQPQKLTGQIVHARRCYKRMFFIDLRINESFKCTILFRSDDSRENLPGELTDHELISHWKRVRRGDKVCVPVFEASEEEKSKRDYPVYQALDFVVLKAWPGNDPFPPEPAMGLKKSNSSSDTLPGEVMTAICIRSTVSTLSMSSTSSTQLKMVIEGDSIQSTELAPWEDYCKFWINSLKCIKKDCLKRHPTGTEYNRVQEIWVKEHSQARKERSKLLEDPHAISSKVPHSQRALIFCKWLVREFGKDFLNSGSGVLDIAGGKGEVSMFLTHMFGVRSTVVEPNERKDKPYKRKILMNAIKKQLDIEAGGDGHLYKRMDPLLLALNNQQSMNAQTKPQQEVDHATDAEIIKDEKRRHKKQQIEQFVVPRLTALLDESFLVNHKDVFEGASILIGMHPDQATEPIVDIALKHDKPFAVVPCCVFAHDNPHRRLSDGGRVNTTIEFVQYLMEKKPLGNRISKDYLPFDGINVVVFQKISH